MDKSPERMSNAKSATPPVSVDSLPNLSIYFFDHIYIMGADHPAFTLAGLCEFKSTYS